MEVKGTLIFVVMALVLDSRVQGSVFGFTTDFLFAVRLEISAEVDP